MSVHYTVSFAISLTQLSWGHNKISCGITRFLQLRTILLDTDVNIIRHHALVTEKHLKLQFILEALQSTCRWTCIPQYQPQLNNVCYMHTNIIAASSRHQLFSRAVLQKHQCMEVNMEFIWTRPKIYRTLPIFLSFTWLQNILLKARSAHVSNRPLLSSITKRNMWSINSYILQYNAVPNDAHNSWCTRFFHISFNLSDNAPWKNNRPCQ